jgi:hypothetical protein
LYRCTITFDAPSTASNVRSINSRRDCTSTSMVTSSGMRFSSISLRTKSKSVCDADGKPTSISLKPVATSISKNSSFAAMLIGSINAWLPSRRSVLIQTGAFSMVRVGQRRPFRRTCGNGRYFSEGLCIMIVDLVYRWLRSACERGRSRRLAGSCSMHAEMLFRARGHVASRRW